MSKTGGSYASVVLGVSEQVAHDRRPGQHEEQINMISDPVRGLSRRWGSTLDGELMLGAGKQLSTYSADGAKMREYSFTIAEKQYTLLFRATASALDASHLMWCYSKDEHKFIPVQMQASSPLLNQLATGGISAVACVGRYLYIAGNTVTPTYTISNSWGATGNQSYGVAWVRTGSYSRTYTVTVTKTDGTTVVGTYTTNPSAYPELNDTSSISFYMPDGTTPDPEYQKKINDANALYNSKVTKYIGDSAADITPENIASKLAASLSSFGVIADANAGTVQIYEPLLSDLSSTDGADGSTLITVGNEVSNVDKLSFTHYVGKIVRIRPQGASDKEAFYLRADAKNDGNTGWQEVIWRECAGIEQTPTSMWAFAAFYDGVLKVADSPTNLDVMTGDTSPTFKKSLVGDAASSPIPNFYGKKVTLLAVFQDRLVVGSDDTVTCSVPGDYLNFYRHTVLQVQDDDPVEMYSYGADGDVLRYTVMFDRDLVIFGDQKQYAVSGRSVLTPKAPNISVMSSHEDSTQAAPAASGTFVLYGKQRKGRTSMNQLQVGQLTDSPDSVDVSAQLDTYIKGRPAQIIALTSPNTVLYRTEIPSSSLYVYNYIDNQNSRVFDSWSTWKYNEVLGTICGVSAHKGELLIFMLRQGSDGLYLTADRQSLSTDLSDLPYMDSMTPYTGVAGWYTHADKTKISCVIDSTHNSFLLGNSWDQAPGLLTQIPDAAPALWLGAVSEGLVTPTNPYFRDQNGKAVLEGRLTLTHVSPSLVNTGGLVATVTTRNSETVNDGFIGRIIGRLDNLSDKQPNITESLVVGIGAETRECSYTFATKTWLPLTITGIGWVGQYFNRVRRAG